MGHSHSSPTLPNRMSGIPWQDGYYKCSKLIIRGDYCADTILVKGNTIDMLGFDYGGLITPKLAVGEFGRAADEVVAVTGKTEYNVELRSTARIQIRNYGVISEDGKKMTFMDDIVGVGWMEWITEEEAAAIEAARDPIEAPPHPYKEQPGNLGKFLWITGPPGSGKSTLAKLLARNAGYVYYDADNFHKYRNPYIPPDSDLQFYEFLCDDINRGRERIGGDWAVAMHGGFTRQVRDLVRSRLGPDVTFVVLDMAWEDMEERFRSRHRGNEKWLEIMMPTYRKIYETFDPAGGDESNTVGIKVVPGDTSQQVAEKILDQV